MLELAVCYPEVGCPPLRLKEEKNKTGCSLTFVLFFLKLKNVNCWVECNTGSSVLL